MNTATLGIASDFVKAGIEKAGIPVAKSPEHLGETLAGLLKPR